jgi:nitrite reductase (NO-forming)
MTLKEITTRRELDDELATLLDDELKHAEDLEERTERLEMRSSMSVLFSAMAVIGVLIVAVLVITFGNESLPAEPASTGAAATEADTQSDPATAFSGAVEKYERPDPALPAIPAGAVKKFRMDVYEHVTRVSKDLPPTRVWSYAINGVEHRGTGVSGPMVVTEGDMVEVTLVNGSSKKMAVNFQHSIDFHSSELAPNDAFRSIDPGKTHVFRFRADHPGVFMYHCATPPVLMHTGAGMVGMMVVKPKNLAPVDRELWMTQQEFYVGKPGADADMKKMEAKAPSAITFNGYANQYATQPIKVKKGERIRMYVLNAGPSIWSAFHVIGTVFDRTVVEGVVGHDAQTVNLAPSQGGWVEFTLDAEGGFPFVTHAFGDMTKGAMGVLATEHYTPAPKGAAH